MSKIGFIKTFFVWAMAVVAIVMISSCSKETVSKESLFVGTWDCTEDSEPNGIFNKDYVYYFDASGIFYNVYDGKNYARGTYHVNDTDLFIVIGTSQIHWDVTIISDTKVSLYSTRSGYEPGSATLVKRK